LTTFSTARSATLLARSDCSKQNVILVKKKGTGPQKRNERPEKKKKKKEKKEKSHLVHFH
jgi:hypothetical protein